jgi:pseudo-rSAM protein
MKTDRYSWLYLEPFVHLAVREEKVLLYNTLSHKMVVSAVRPSVIRICRSLLKPANGCVTRIDQADLSKTEIAAFIGEIRKNFMGDLLKPSWSEKKPVMVLPKPLIKRKKTLQPGTGIEMLREITIHLSTCNSGLPREYRQASRQFPFPLFANGKKKELDPAILHSVLNDCVSAPRLNLNFVSDNLNDYSHKAELFQHLSRSPHRVRFFTFPSTSGFSNLRTMPKGSVVIFLLTSPFSEEVITGTQQDIVSSGYRIRPEWHFVVQDSHELTEANRIIQSIPLKDAFFKPYFNKTNQAFFRDYIYITEEDLRASNPDQKQIFARKVVNETEWGKVILLPGGKLHANINDPPIGNLRDNGIDELVRRELERGTSWKRIRAAVTPCKDCLFQLICPPVSNYELLMKRFNLCHLY